MTTTVSHRVRIGTATLATGLILGVVPGIATPTAALAKAPTPTTLALYASPARFVAGRTIGLTARLSVANKQVSFYEAYRGQGPHLIYQGTSDSSGYVVITGTALHSAVYTAAFSGDGAYAGSSASVSTTVEVAMSIKATGGAKRKGYRLYRQSKKATVATAVGPSKTGGRVTFRLQVRRNGHYRTIDTRRYTLRKGSAVAVTYRGKAGYRYRVRAEYSGDSLNTGNTTAWTYSRFRR